ncbi:serine/threonine-protein kinase [Butyrivibrio sp. YAB3001]|uniref:serine/threonine-protein kinase n=1 Tax=Butyrivibrio sp. YAB3001 TaxID=1520812 RepID=UPI0008F64898|nr:serine/threonine-protein kinase [Butyrivibrio sp. YAB3001]SFB82207.1 Tetratricopeptide repeat-containing protein [Butyrivibrio sp. YAB3001]
MNSNDKKKSFLETYEIKEQLGEGSGGTVYKAYHKNLRKDVVLKKMNEKAAEVLNKRTETDALKNLRHSYIPQVLDFVELDDGIYTVMDYIPGTTFKKLMDTGRRFSQKEALKYARQLFETLEYIHSRKPKIIHGDIKPDNIMLTPEDNICLIDFNISGIADGEGAVIDGFSYDYSAPEQVEGFKRKREQKTKQSDENFEYEKTEIISAEAENNDDYEKTSLVEEAFLDKDELRYENVNTDHKQDFYIDERADIYSAAASIYHILTGVRPKVKEGRIPPANSIDPKISEGFSYILEHAMEQKPDKRFQSSSDVLKALNEIHKLDNRYKKLIRQQNLLFCVAIFMMSVGVALIFNGINSRKMDNLSTYDRNIELMTEMIRKAQNGDEISSQEFDELYDECVKINNKQLDVYLNKAIFLYTQKNYDAAIEYLEENVLDDPVLSVQTDLETAYYIYGSSLKNCEEPDYESAIESMEKAISKGYTNASCYRELAETYLVIGKLAKAKEILSEAEEKSVSGADMDLMAGEVNLAQNNYSDAKKNYESCIEKALLTGDYDVLLRAYLGLNELIITENKNETSLNEAVSVLNKAMNNLPGDYQLQVVQSQIQNYVDLYQLTQDSVFAEKGIELLEKSISRGWKDYTNYVNLAFLYEQKADYNKAKEILEKLMNEYPDNYVAYKRMAYLEVDVQKNKEVNEREYSFFAYCYETAKTKYKNSKKIGGDLEMDYLDAMYSEAVENGWIE